MVTPNPRNTDPITKAEVDPTPTSPNREPGTREHPHASRPRRDLEDRAAVEEQEGEGREHLYGHRTLDGQATRPHYLGNSPRGRQARHIDDVGAAEGEPLPDAARPGE